MKCEICGKEILRDSQCINYKYYHNDCIENLEKQNKQLKDKIPYIIQNNSCKYISIEKYKNKVCVNYKMQELQESDSNVKEKDFFKTCFNAIAGLEVKNENQAIAKEVVLNEIENLQQENNQLKCNWNKLKEYLNYKSERAVGEDEYVYDEIYNEMQELQGSGE